MSACARMMRPRTRAELLRRESLVRLLRRPRITAELAEALGVKRIEAIAQLKTLEEMGIIYRAERIGKDQVWERRTPPK